MLRGDTNVSHFALHGHRIGIHRAKIDRSTDQAASFEPILDISHCSAIEQQRLRGLAKYEIHRRHGGNPKFADFNIEATGELIQIKQAGKADSDVDAALVWLARDQGQTEIAENIARELLANEKNQTMPRIVATIVLAQIAFGRKQFEQAVALYRTLDGYHRDGRDTYYLGLSEQNTRNTEKAIEALKRSIAIEPSQVAAHAALHAIYLSTGREAEAEIHRRAAEQNQLLQQKQSVSR
jgi:Flp pilus assembly protein TadD